MPNIHKTAIVDPSARLADDVRVGPFCVVEDHVEIGPGCALHEGVVVRRYTTIGRGNIIDAHCVLGGPPQDLKFDPATVSYLKIGDRNTFREGVTISRASLPGQSTVIGNDCYWMAYAHAGHDVTVADKVIMANGALLGGHARVGARAFLSAHVTVHQFTWIGEGVMSRGQAGVSMHVPPYALIADINRVAGLNVVGMRRNEQMTSEDRRQLKEAFRLTYRCGLSPRKALEQIDSRADWGPFAETFRRFLREVITAGPPFDRGLCPRRKRFFHQS